MASVLLRDFCAQGWGLAKAVFKATEPYQPAVATAFILGKLSWRLCRQKPLEREIADLEERIKRLDSIFEKKVFQNEAPARNLRKELQAELEEKRHQRNIAVLTFGQIPSLFFAHPGANVYQGLHQLIGRGYTIHRQVNDETPPTLASRVKSVGHMTASLVSLVGTLSSLGRWTGLIAADNWKSHLLSRMAIAVHTTEGAFIAYDGLKKFLAWYREKPPSWHLEQQIFREEPLPAATV